MHSKYLTILLVLPLLLATSCSLIVTPPLEQPHQPLQIAPKIGETTPLFLFSHGHHTGLTLPAEVFREELAALGFSLESQWLEFGWGDEGFYRSERVTLPLAVRALAYPTPGVMHVAASGDSPEKLYPYSPLRIFEMSPTQTQALRHFLLAGFARDESGSLIELGSGRYGVSRFFRARDKFYFPRTCNSWSARGLRSIGIKVRAITSPGLLRQL